MKAKIIILIALITIEFIDSKAQVSGYMGKRTILEYNLLFSPAFLNPTENDPFKDNYGIINGNISFNKTHSFQFEYILNRRVSVGATFNMYKTRVQYEDYIDLPSFDDIYSTEPEMVSENVTVKGDVTGYSFGLNFTYYFDNIAPVGLYWKTGVLFMPYKFDLFRLEKGYSNGEIISGDNVFIDDNGYYAYGITFEYGKHKVYFNRIVTKLGMGFGYVFPSLGIKDDITNSNIVYRSSNKRLFFMNVFYVNAGIGVLLF